MQVIATWSGGRADLLRQAFRMTNESYAEYLTVSVRTVANWRGNPGVIPRLATQDILDAALERAPDRISHDTVRRAMEVLRQEGSVFTVPHRILCRA
jgi:hypothetical protein